MRLSNLPKVTQLVNGRAGFTQDLGVQTTVLHLDVGPFLLERKAIPDSGDS